MQTISEKVLICAIVCITALEVTNLLTTGKDGAILSSIVGAIVFIATRQYYKSWRKEGGEY